MEGDCGWVFYIIANGGATYAGVSPDPHRRLRQHNQELSGGAKYTTSKAAGGWRHVVLVSGFQTKIQALQFEWAVKHVPPRDRGGLSARLIKLQTVLARQHWTKAAPLAETVSLVVTLQEAEPVGLPAWPQLPYVTVKRAEATTWNNCRILDFV